ncbi:MAG TPA: hypothetical protein VJQ52_08270 [Steroidobacteraceae bacterium]|nr:hypothetical protein [Steroidobacteraceae bacterium]
MTKLLALTTLSVASLGVAALAIAHNDDDNDDWPEHSSKALTLAVYGDAPYGCKAPTAAGASDECPPNSIYRADDPNLPNPGDPRQIEATPAFIDAVNRDRKVELVIHVGDIHSGAQFCTVAYNRTILNLWSRFDDPLVYTPGDNEWADCQKAKEGGGVTNAAGEYVDYAAGNPVANLALVRQMFFPEPGRTLGEHRKRVTSQAQAFDPAFPADGEYVENVMWEQSQVLFVTINVPGGSNNDNDTWNTAAFGSAFGATGNTKSATQLQDMTQRTAADLRWLDAAFARAKAHGAKAVVIVDQADMWDLDGTLPADNHLAKYEPVIAKMAAQAQAFGKPVLLFNGDSHRYRSDNPLKQGQPCVVESGADSVGCGDDDWATHPNYDVSNFHRVVVHGSVFPLEYLRLSIDTRANRAASATSFGPFSWERVIP